MEQTDSSIFKLEVDHMVRSNLTETASWARFLAIFGMIMCALIVVMGIVVATVIPSTVNDYNREFGYNQSVDTTGLTVTMVVFYAIIAIVYFFPCLFTLRFANHMKRSLRAGDQASLTESFRNLKVAFRYLGILTIIFIAFMLIGLLFGGLGALMMMGS